MLYSDPATCRGLVNVKMKVQPNLGKEGKGGVPLSEHQGLKGSWLLIMVRESDGDDNPLTLCDCCWQEGEGLGRKSKCLLHCLYIWIKHS